MAVQDARLRAVRVLMGVAALGALVAAFGAIGSVADAGASTMMVETWRLYGFLTFAGLFALLGWRPRSHPWLWEIVILNKLLLTVTAGAYAAGVLGPGEVDEAAIVVVSDGTLTAILLVAYVVGEGWRSR